MKNIPKIHFRGFSEEWEEKELGEMGVFFSGGTPLTSNKNYYEGNIPFIGSGNINDIKVQQFISQEALKNSSAKLVEKGDLLYALYGATSGEVAISKLNGAINQAVLCIRSNQNIYFLYQYLKINKNFIISTFLQGGQGNLSASIIKSLNIHLPPIQEQQKIGKLFETIDKLILTQERKQKQLENIKKSFLEKLFPQDDKNIPKIRFRGFSEEWEERKIKNIFDDITRGYVLSKNKISNKQTTKFKYPVYSSQTLNNGLLGYYSEYLYENAITWTTDGANAGDVKYRKEKFYCTNVSGVLISKKGFSNQCIAEILNTQTKKYVSYVGNPKLMNNVMSEIIINIPPLILEQQKIGIFFQKLDKLLELNQQKITKLKQIKKSLLNKMLI